MLGHLFEEFLGALEVIVDEYLGVVVCTLGPLFTVAVHVVPTEFADDVLKLAHLAMEAEAHVEVGAALVDMPVGAVLSLFTTLLHKIGANFQIMAEVALVAVPARTHRLELVARLDLALVVRVGAVVRQPALPVDELLADPVRRQLVVVGRRRGWLGVWCPLVLSVEIAGVG